MIWRWLGLAGDDDNDDGDDDDAAEWKFGRFLSSVYLKVLWRRDVGCDVVTLGGFFRTVVLVVVWRCWLFVMWCHGVCLDYLERCDESALCVCVRGARITLMLNTNEGFLGRSGGVEGGGGWGW